MKKKWMAEAKLDNRLLPEGPLGNCRVERGVCDGCVVVKQFHVFDCIRVLLPVLP